MNGLHPWEQARKDFGEMMAGYQPPMTLRNWITLLKCYLVVVAVCLLGLWLA